VEIVPVERRGGHETGSASFVESKLERFSRGERPMGTPDSHALELARTVKLAACKKLMYQSTGQFTGFRIITHEMAIHVVCKALSPQSEIQS
jgi:hypothetical protein